MIYLLLSTHLPLSIHQYLPFHGSHRTIKATSKRTSGYQEIKWNILPSIHHIPSLSFTINVFPQVHFPPSPIRSTKGIQKPTESTGPPRLCKYSSQPSGAPCLSSCNPHDLYVSMVAPLSIIFCHPSLIQYMGACLNDIPEPGSLSQGYVSGGCSGGLFRVERQK